MTKNLLEQGFEAQARSLREFGYPDITPDMVREAHRKWKAGEEASDIIERFCESAFEGHPDIFGEPA